MEHKLENCGRCGLEAKPLKNGQDLENPWCECPVHGGLTDGMNWNAAQFAARTERINAAAVAICAGANSGGVFHTDVIDAEELIAIQDERARVRWAEMQKGE